MTSKSIQRVRQVLPHVLVIQNQSPFLTKKKTKKINQGTVSLAIQNRNRRLSGSTKMTSNARQSLENYKIQQRIEE